MGSTSNIVSIEQLLDALADAAGLLDFNAEPAPTSIPASAYPLVEREGGQFKFEIYDLEGTHLGSTAFDTQKF